MPDCLNNPNTYRIIDHLQIIENSGIIHGIFERYKGDPAYDGICYFRYNINDVDVGPGHNPTSELNTYFVNVVEDPDCLIVPSSRYGGGRLRILQLDVSVDVNILYIPENIKKVDNECIFYGIINSTGSYTSCPSTPVNVQGKVKKIFTFFKTENTTSGVINVHPLRIYHLERCESDDNIKCTVDNEGHWNR
ncbi:hypothetical protein [Candidatus Nitrosocosmicus sp. SS]|jgi:hypothetical protein|uniref:hypothetical protein n=1 Tax=Candidatus Nitrosocosmicus agrestis TaxID=2563600 RepID=UPI00122E12A4|nr:hypothetical protein [Candidatus Nitrosocosmicus sp. SS]KAA2282089.1 hypothetical protein F1Z66_06520 [Candidatus Nitrosocosmicus sp. SS]KAF0870066.1 hypothetical protein E5N71_02290 [Candidatus Nitrosocosmicus sp. SS]